MKFFKKNNKFTPIIKKLFKRKELERLKLFVKVNEVNSNKKLYYVKELGVSGISMEKSQGGWYSGKFFDLWFLQNLNNAWSFIGIDIFK